MTLIAIANLFVTKTTTVMANAIVFLTVILFAIAAATRLLSKLLSLIFSSLNGGLPIIIMTIRALAFAFFACLGILEADAIELQALASFAIAPFLTGHFVQKRSVNTTRVPDQCFRTLTVGLHNTG